VPSTEAEHDAGCLARLFDWGVISAGMQPEATELVEGFSNIPRVFESNRATAANTLFAIFHRETERPPRGNCHYVAIDCDRLASPDFPYVRFLSGRLDSPGLSRTLQETVLDMEGA
jgi:hypothetical protein